MRSVHIYYTLTTYQLHFPAAGVLIGHHFPHEISRDVRLDPALCLAHSQLHRSVYKAGQRRKEDGWGVAARDCK